MTSRDKSITLGVRISQSEHERLLKFAAKKDVSITDVLRAGLSQFIDLDKNPLHNL